MHILLHSPALLVNIIATLKDKFEVKSKNSLMLAGLSELWARGCSPTRPSV